MDSRCLFFFLLSGGEGRVKEVGKRQRIRQWVTY